MRLDVFLASYKGSLKGVKGQKRCVDVAFFERSDFDEIGARLHESADVVKAKILRCKVVFNEHTLNGREGSLLRDANGSFE